MAFDDEAAQKRFKEPFDLIIRGETISWVPGSLTLVVDPLSEKARAIAVSLEEFIAKSADYGYELPVTPVGPFLVASATNPYTFVWAANNLYGDTGIKVNGHAPTMKDLGLSSGRGTSRGKRRIY